MAADCNAPGTISSASCCLLLSRTGECRRVCIYSIHTLATASFSNTSHNVQQSGQQHSSYYKAGCRNTYVNQFLVSFTPQSAHLPGLTTGPPGAACWLLGSLTPSTSLPKKDSSSSSSESPSARDEPELLVIHTASEAPGIASLASPAHGSAVEARCCRAVDTHCCNEAGMESERQPMSHVCGCCDIKFDSDVTLALETCKRTCLRILACG